MTTLHSCTGLLLTHATHTGEVAAGTKNTIGTTEHQCANRIISQRQFNSLDQGKASGLINGIFCLWPIDGDLGYIGRGAGDDYSCCHISA